jgi:nitrilase
LRTEVEKDPLLRGGSCIINPLGEFIVPPNYGGETILMAELDMALLSKGRFDLDVVGHYARPDIFSLQVDTSERLSVKTKVKEK